MWRAFNDVTCEIATGRTRQRRSFHFSLHVLHVARIDRRGAHLDENFAAPRLRTCDLGNLEHVEIAEFFKTQSFHVKRYTRASSTSGGCRDRSYCSAADS